jgi:hypothetical protein
MQIFMKVTSLTCAATLLILPMASAVDYNLGALAKANKIPVINRSLDPTKVDAAQEVFLTAAPGDGLAWIEGVEFTQGTIELEMKGKNEPGRSFVGIAFHGKDDRIFDVVYLRPFNFQNSEAERRSHSIQYVSLPDYDWNKLRTTHPGKYEFGIASPPDPGAWVKLKLVIKGKNLTAFVNGSDLPALNVELLNDRLGGKAGLWVGNGSDGCFRNLKIIPDSE